ncbi:MAG: hypothetical protein ACJAUY_000941 [Cognaticolwellia sp.]|jgi:hypothetical protein
MIGVGFFYKRLCVFLIWFVFILGKKKRLPKGKRIKQHIIKT